MAYVAKPTIVSRNSWGAGTNSCTTLLPKGNVTKLVLHHCVYPDSTINGSTEAQHQKKIQDGHKAQKWCDIGYHFGIGKNGTILEGMPLTKQGINVANHNHYTIGVVVHGDYRTRTLTSAQKTAIIKLLAWLCYDYGLTSSAITYHQALANTICPGDNIISQVSSIRSGVYNLLNSGPIS
ncbi:hypothetical protein CQS04_05200 [Chryseomicrobium excrementi]|uniref:N-acetylmuramoyl-L-alanine amidase n=1 Tax=Chryseomicrobium excrementi TaxID=2041346 RepID=A0A2M9EZB5_9BACL|nr:peptidoglycan recognition family protein [Chryseomicrobium excrementi]PJK16558.1 hypothetical protein CQS04_05200 [Chryseomicrobium excrementi]